METKKIAAILIPIISLSFGAIKGMDWLDKRYDIRYASEVSVQAKIEGYTTKTQISLLDIQMMIVEGHIRDAERMSETRELNLQEKRDLRLDEVRLTSLQKERRRILGSPQ